MTLALPITQAVSATTRATSRIESTGLADRVRAELDRVGFLRTAEALRTRLGARLVHLDTERINLGRDAHALREGEHEAPRREFIDWAPSAPALNPIAAPAGSAAVSRKGIR